MLYGMSYMFDLYMVYYDGLLDTPEIFTQKAASLNAHPQHNTTTMTLRLACSFGCIARLGLLVIERSTF